MEDEKNMNETIDKKEEKENIVDKRKTVKPNTVKKRIIIKPKKKNKNGKSYKFIIGVIFVGYIIYKFLFNSTLELEIYDKEFEKLMIENKIGKVVCVKNREIVNVYLKDKNSLIDSINIINQIRGYNILASINNLSEGFKGYFSKHKKISFFLVVPSVSVFDKNFKIIESKMDENKKIGYEVMIYTSWFTIIMNGISTLFSLFFFYYILLNIGLVKGGSSGLSGALGFGKSKGKLYDKNSKDKITFDDVAGLTEPKQECQEIIKLLKNPDKLNAMGGKLAKGILFVGPPGTGKTLLAKAIAGECDASFFYISASDIGGIFYGLGVAHIRALFKEAKEHAPAIIFIDEIDSIGKARTSRGISSGDQDNTLNSLLVEMDGFENNSDIIVIASTNRVDTLDKALLRPGRFDIKIQFDNPVLKERIDIINLYLKKIKVKQEDVNIERLAEQTSGFSAAEIANVCNEAALLAVMNNREYVEWEDFQEAMDRIILGLERKSRKVNEKEKRIVSYHEAGHTLVSWFLEHAEPLLKVTIIPRGNALGYAQYTPEERFIKTKEEMIDNLCISLGGRCSEELNFNTMSTGASEDLSHVYSIAYNIVTVFGMNDKIGNVSYYSVLRNNPYITGKPYSEETAAIIDREIKKLIDENYARVKRLLTEKKELLDKLADELFNKEVLLKDDVKRIIGPREPYFT